MATAPIKKNTKKSSAPKKAPVKKAVAPKATAGKLSAPIYNVSGKEVGTANLSEGLFGAAWNNNLVYQVATSMQSNARAGLGLAHTKDRGEVRGGGKKPWKQKGTGRARHGSSRSPLWTGGGVTHGPRNDKNYEKQIPRKMRIAALRSVLSRKLADGEVLFIDKIAFDAPKTATAKDILIALSGISGFERLTKKNNAALIALSTNDVNTKKSFSNFGNIEVEEARNMNVVDVLSKAYLIIENPDVTLATLEAKLS
jgi:large subunit ribosomal protein L4